MRNLSSPFKKLFGNQWFIGLFLLGAFLAANGYTYGWDDQHLEIPLLKKLIDPTLYPGDYYVESLKTNFASFLFPILAKLITVKQIPAVYFSLYLLSRYFLFFFIYKIWYVISGRSFTALLCTLNLIIIGRVDEFLYRTFSHQELALAIIFGAVYLFYRNRYLFSALVFGIAVNIHALYSLFPFSYMILYLLLKWREEGRKHLFPAIGIFILGAAPFFIWSFKKYFFTPETAPPEIFTNWLSLYHLACPQNFIFYDKSLAEVFRDWPALYALTAPYIGLAALYVLQMLCHQKFRHDLKSRCFIYAGVAYLLITLFFTYAVPIRFVIDLNLIRNTQYMLFILVGYTTILIINKIEKEPWLCVLLLSALLPLIRFGDTMLIATVFTLMVVIAFFYILEKNHWRNYTGLLILLGVLFGGCLAFLTKHFMDHPYNRYAILSLRVTFALLIFIFLTRRFLQKYIPEIYLRRLMIAIPFIVFLINFSFFHMTRLKVEQTGGGFWQLQRNWIDMQNYVKENTPKNAYLLVPHDMEMGGFRIHSERKIIMSYRDCGIVGFDYPAGVEWQRRLSDIGAFQVFIKEPVGDALTNAMAYYKVNYIVFMKYMAPPESNILQPVYANETFALYKVRPNPVPEN